MSKDWLKVLIYAPVQNDIRKWPIGAKKDFGSILTKLQKREVVGFPDVKPMPDLASGAAEIRLRDSTGNYRIFYIVKSDFGIF